MTNNFYVYFHVHAGGSAPVVFYVGKGHKHRATDVSQRSRFWKAVAAKYGFEVLIADDNLSEEEAFKLEKEYISRIGRRDLGLGTLVNMTDGGDGCQYQSPLSRKAQADKLRGRKHTMERRRNISLGQLGKVLPDEVKKKVSETMKARYAAGWAPSIGYKHTEECRLRMSAAQKARQERNRNQRNGEGRS